MRRRVGRWAMVVSTVVASLFVDGPRAQESPTLSAMQDEMKRSMAELRMKGEAAPYYIAYELLDRTMSDISGRLGAIVETPPRRTRRREIVHVVFDVVRRRLVLDAEAGHRPGELVAHRRHDR